MVKDLELFEELMLAEGAVSVVTCYTRSKPPSETPYPHYLHQHESKDSVIVYSGLSKVCEFYVPHWHQPNPEIAVFIQGMLGMSTPSAYHSTSHHRETPPSGSFHKQERVSEVEVPRSRPKTG